MKKRGGKQEHNTTKRESGEKARKGGERKERARKERKCGAKT